MAIDSPKNDFAEKHRWLTYADEPDTVYDGSKIMDGSVTTDKLADYAVTTDKIDDESITTVKLDDGVITTPKLADGAVTNEKISSGALSALTLTPTLLKNLVLPSGYYVQSMAIANGVIYVALSPSNASNNPKINTYDFATGTQIASEEYSNATVGHVNFLAYNPTASQLITTGTDNNSLVYINVNTLEIAGTHSLSAPISGLCISSDGNHAFAIPTNRRIGQRYFIDTVDNYFVARNNAPIYTNDLLAQDISYSLASVNFAAGVFLRDVSGKHYNYIYQIDTNNGLTSKVYFLNVPTTTEIQGIETYNGTQYVIDSLGGFYSVALSDDYRTSVLSLYPVLNWNKTDKVHKSLFSNGTNYFEIPIYFPIPYDQRDSMQGIPILFRTTKDNYQLIAYNTGGTIRGFTSTNNGQHTIGLEYASKNTDLAYLSRVRIDSNTQTFSGTNITTISSALDTFIGGLNITTNIGLNLRGYGVTPYGGNNTVIPASV